MAKWRLWLKQFGEGCDYTIGCGQKMMDLKAVTYQSALEEADKEVRERGLDEQAIQEAILIPVDSTIPINVSKINFEMETERRQAKEKTQKEKEEAEFERLKKKLGK